jgi:hypothetical protein
MIEKEIHPTRLGPPMHQNTRLCPPGACQACAARRRHSNSNTYSERRQGSCENPACRPINHRPCRLVQALEQPVTLRLSTLLTQNITPCRDRLQRGATLADTGASSRTREATAAIAAHQKRVEPHRVDQQWLELARGCSKPELCGVPCAALGVSSHEAHLSLHCHLHLVGFSPLHISPGGSVRNKL